MKQKEIDDWNKKVVVKNTHFTVNTMEKVKVSQTDRFKNIREDQVQKVGLRLNQKRIASLVDR
jgi:cystathionine beta-lyase family protein involved in aluminum resistance